jgi:hypothetical protein
MKPSTRAEWKEAAYACLTIGTLIFAVVAIIGSRL